MTTDSRILLKLLKEYAFSLEEHLHQLNAEYQQLESDWKRFNQVAQGGYAEQFRGAWQKSQSQFSDYQQGANKVLDFLQEKITYLEQFKKGEPTFVEKSFAVAQLAIGVTSGVAGINPSLAQPINLSSDSESTYVCEIKQSPDSLTAREITEIPPDVSRLNDVMDLENEKKKQESKKKRPDSSSPSGSSNPPSP